MVLPVFHLQVSAILIPGPIGSFIVRTALVDQHIRRETSPAHFLTHPGACSRTQPAPPLLQMHKAVPKVASVASQHPAWWTSIATSTTVARHPIVWTTARMLWLRERPCHSYIAQPRCTHQSRHPPSSTSTSTNWAARWLRPPNPSHPRKIKTEVSKTRPETAQAEKIWGFRNPPRLRIEINIGFYLD